MLRGRRRLLQCLTNQHSVRMRSSVTIHYSDGKLPKFPVQHRIEGGVLPEYREIVSMATARSFVESGRAKVKLYFEPDGPEQWAVKYYSRDLVWHREVTAGLPEAEIEAWRRDPLFPRSVQDDLALLDLHESLGCLNMTRRHSQISWADKRTRSTPGRPCPDCGRGWALILALVPLEFEHCYKVVDVSDGQIPILCKETFMRAAISAAFEKGHDWTAAAHRKAEQRCESMVLWLIDANHQKCRTCNDVFRITPENSAYSRADPADMRLGPSKKSVREEEARYILYRESLH